MKVIRITKKDEKNVIVWLDNDEKLYLAYEVLLKNGLRKDSEISEGLFSFLVIQNQKYHIKQRAINYLARRHHSVKELKIKLRQKKYDDNLIDEVLNELVESHLLNDEKFAEIYIEEMARIKLWGKIKLKSELIKKGVAPYIIDSTIEKYFPDEEIKSNAFTLAEKKIKFLSSKNLESSKLRQKIISYLYGKGYSFDECKDVVDQLIKDNN